MSNKKKGSSPKSVQTKDPLAQLDPPTITVPENSVNEIVSMADLAGLVYPDSPNPVVFFGVPDPYVGEFKKKFIMKGEKPAVTKKPGGNRNYIRISRVLDLYKLCLALDGRTLVHQKAVKAIRTKLEQKYGKQALQAAIQS